MRTSMPARRAEPAAVAGANGACEQRFTSLLIEDQTRHDVSYVDFLCSVHRQIQAKLTA